MGDASGEFAEGSEFFGLNELGLGGFEFFLSRFKFKIGFLFKAIVAPKHKSEN